MAAVGYGLWALLLSVCTCSSTVLGGIGVLQFAELFTCVLLWEPGPPQEERNKFPTHTFRRSWLQTLPQPTNISYCIVHVIMCCYLVVYYIRLYYSIEQYNVLYHITSYYAVPDPEMPPCDGKRRDGNQERAETRAAEQPNGQAGKQADKANLRTRILDFRGFDSSRILTL